MAMNIMQCNASDASNSAAINGSSENSNLHANADTDADFRDSQKLSPRSYWAAQAWVEGAVRSNVRFTVADGAYAQITTDEQPHDGDIMLDGLVMPGAADCHSHTFHRALRGLGREGATFWSWRDTMYRVAANLTPELYYEYARRVYAEMLMSGYTTVAEFHYVHHRPDGTPYDEPNAMGLALARAAHDAGIRLTLLDTCYLHADVQGNDLGERQRRFGDGDVESWVSRVDALDRAIQSDETLRESVRVGAAVHSVRACSQREAQVVAQWSRGEIGDGRNVHNIYSAHGASVRPLHVHLSEQTAENEACREATGMSPVELLDKAGVWGPNAVAVHATHLSSSDIATLGAAHARAAICPTTEADLADGIPAAAAMRDAGIDLCIGSDENVSIDPFEEIRRLDGNQRLVSGQRDTFAPAELVAMMTEQGQAASGWSESGRISVGALADFVVIDTAAPHLAGVRAESILLVATAADVRDVAVGGRFVVRNHQSNAMTADDVSDGIHELTERLRT